MDDLKGQLDQMEPPRIRTDAARAAIRLTVMNARTSSRIGLALVAVPSLFVLGVILHYGAGMPVPGLGALEDGFLWLDRNVPVVSPLILAGAPLLAIVLNVLAIMHVGLDRERRELNVNVRLRWLNLAIILIAAVIVLAVFGHLVAERANHVRGVGPTSAIASRPGGSAALNG